MGIYDEVVQARTIREGTQNLEAELRRIAWVLAWLTVTIAVASVTVKTRLDRIADAIECAP